MSAFQIPASMEVCVATESMPSSAFAQLDFLAESVKSMKTIACPIHAKMVETAPTILQAILATAIQVILSFLFYNSATL